MKISYKNISHVFPVALTTLVVLLCAVLPVRAQVVVEMKLDTAEIMVGQQVQLTTSVSTDAGNQVTFPSYNKEKELVKGLEVINHSKVDTAYLNDKKRVKLSRKYTITAFDSALFSIPPMQVEVAGKLYTANAPVGLKVNTVPVDTTKLDLFAGPHTVVPEAFTWRSHLYVLCLLSWLVLILVFFIAIRLTRRKPLTTKKVIIPQIPPFKQASVALQQLKAPTRNDHESEKAFYMALTELVRVYLQRRYNVLALEKTTSEIIDAMVDKVDEVKINNLKTVFETADFVKFAKVVTSDMEKSKCMSIVADFLKETVDDTQEHPEPEVQIIVLNDGMQQRYRRLLWVSIAILTIGGIVYTCCTGMMIVKTFF